MISRHSGHLGHFLRCSLLASASLLPGLAGAGEIQPFDIPAEPAPLDGPEINSSLPDFVEPTPGDDAAAAAATPAAPAPGTQPIAPPAIDAYVDLSFNNSDVTDFGYNDNPGGYRFIAGFVFQQYSTEKMTLAPEVGYVRIGLADESVTTITANNPIPQYRNIKTDLRSLDLSTLTFGVRAGFRLAEHLDGFARGGLHFYHGSRHDQTTYSYEPIAPNDVELPDDARPTFSTSDVGTDYYISGGLAFNLGSVPALYAEYGVYAVGSDNIATTSLGFLLNF